MANLTREDVAAKANIIFHYALNQSHVIGELLCDEAIVTKCKINLSKNFTKWTISEWFTSSDFQHMGFGKVLLKATLKDLTAKYSLPKEVEYIWNGTNQYVFDWLEEHFDAVCECPIAVQKKQADDDFLSHMYVLNTAKIIEYFELA